MRTTLEGRYAQFVRQLTVEAGAGWMPALATAADTGSGTVTVCGVELDRYLTTGSSVERSFATLVAAAIHASGADTDAPEPSGADVLRAFSRGGDTQRDAALLAAYRLLVAR